MNYFIDHAQKKIHQRQYAGDKCGFVETPIEKREFTDSHSYIEQLEMQQQYAKCVYCQTVQIVIE